MSNGWLQRTKDGTLWRTLNEDVYLKALKEGFVAAEPPEVIPMVHVSGGASVPLSSITLPSGVGAPGAAADAQGAMHVAQAAADRAETAVRALEAERRIAELERQLRERDEADTLHAKNTPGRAKFGGASPAR